MEKSSKKIGKQKIISLIKEEAEFLLKKNEYYKKVKDINEEIKSLYENRVFSGTFGFEGDAKNKSISGFVDTPNISYIAQLEKDFAAKDLKDSKENEPSLNEDQLNEIGKLRQENDNLKTKLDEVLAFMKEVKAKKSK